MKKLLLLILIFSLNLNAQIPIRFYENIPLRFQGNIPNRFQGSIPYYFNPISAGIVQGVVNDEVALNNKNIVNAEIINAKINGYNVFVIPEMDVYLGLEGVEAMNPVTSQEGAIHVPENMHIEMNDETFLRVQPNKNQVYTLISTFNSANVRISGGNLVGDKYEHGYYQKYTLNKAPVSGDNINIKIYVGDFDNYGTPTIYNIPVTNGTLSNFKTEVLNYINTSIPDFTATLVSGNEYRIDCSINAQHFYVEFDGGNTDLVYSKTLSSADIYARATTHEWGFLISVQGSRNFRIDNVNLLKSTGDGIYIGIPALRNPDGTLPDGVKDSRYGIIQNCFINDNRRQGISMVDGRDIYVRYNLITDTGKNMATGPGQGVDLEAYRVRNLDGSLSEYEIIRNIRFHGNTYNNNYNGDILTYTCDNIEIFNETMSKGVATSSAAAAHTINIHDNIITRNPLDERVKMSAINSASNIQPVTGEELNHSWTVRNNTISDFDYAVLVGGKDVIVENNTLINNLRGIVIRSVDGLSTLNNSITSNVVDSYGIMTFFGGGTYKNVSLVGDSVTVLGDGLWLDAMDNSLGTMTITGGNFNGGDARNDIRVTNSNNITFGAGNIFTTVTQSGNTDVTGLP